MLGRGVDVVVVLVLVVIVGGNLCLSFSWLGRVVSSCVSFVLVVLGVRWSDVDGMG